MHSKQIEKIWTTNNQRGEKNVMVPQRENISENLWFPILKMLSLYVFEITPNSYNKFL